MDLIIRPSRKQLHVAAAQLVRNGLVEEQTGRLTAAGEVALDYAFLGTPERAGLLADAVLGRGGDGGEAYLRAVVDLVCFEHAIGFQAVDLSVSPLRDRRSDVATVLRMCARLSGVDVVREAAWMGCPPLALRTFHLVRRRLFRDCGLAGERGALADETVRLVVERAARRHRRNRLVKRMGALLQEDGKFEAVAALTGIDLGGGAEGTSVLFEDAFQTAEGTAKCYGLLALVQDAR